MTQYTDILKYADPNCCHRKHNVPEDVVMAENIMFTAISLFVSVILSATQLHTASTIANLITTYMGASTIIYTIIAITQKPTTHLNEDEEVEEETNEDEEVEDEEETNEDEEVEDEEETKEDEEDEFKDMPALVSNDNSDDEMPPLIPLDLNASKVLRQLQQVVDETNARNQVRITRSVLAKANAAARAADVTLATTDPEIKKIN